MKPADKPKKHILFVITQSEFGGAQRFLYSLISYLDCSEYGMTVAIGIDGDGEIIPALKQKNITVLTLNHLARGINFYRDLKALEEFKKILTEFRPDVLFLLSSKAGFVGSLAAKRSGLPIKVIYRIGGWTFNDPWPAWKKTIFLLLEKISAGWKDIIIVNNLHDFEQAQKLKIKPREAIKLIPNGLDVYKMDFLLKEQARSELFAKLKKPDNCPTKAKIIIGTIANYYPAKDLACFIETADLLKNEEDWVFIIIGEGGERPKLEQLIREKGLENKIFLAGRIADAYKFLPAFDVFILTSVKEGFPWAVLEAMAAKLPVIATNVGAIPEIIENGKNGLIIPPQDPQKTAEAVKIVLKSPNLTPKMGIQAHQTVLLKYGFDRVVSQIKELL